MSRRDPAKQVRSGLTGRGAAQKIIDRVKDERRQALIDNLVRQVGVQTAPALEYVARLMRYLIDESDFPSQPAKLRQHEVDYCTRRVYELLQPFVDAGDPRLGPLRGDFGKQAAA